MVNCTFCHRDSIDQEFCDHCNREIRSRIVADASVPEIIPLAEGVCINCSGWEGRWPADSGQYLEVRCGESAFRIHGLRPELWERMRPSVEQRASVTLDVLPPIHYAPVAGGAVVAAEFSPMGRLSLELPDLLGEAEDEVEILERLLGRVRILHSVIRPLHQAGLIWLNFDPQQLETAEGRRRITNLDLQLYRAGECPESLRMSRQYSPAEVYNFRADMIGPATDVFHLSAYAYYTLAGLLPGGFPGGGLSSFDFEIPPLRIYRPRLPPGVAPVIERGLTKDLANRFPSVDAFLAELMRATERVRKRASGPVTVALDRGTACRAGNAKSAAGKPNQDTLHIQEFGDAVVGSDQPAGKNAIVIVADGVSRARVGTGDLASQAACRILAEYIVRRIPAATTNKQVEEVMTEACIEAGREVVRVALSQVPSEMAVRDSDFMSTTALIGIIRGGMLHLANVGDSRAYLVTGTHIEQLTVDGDVGSARLAEGVAPEEVQSMGVEAGALRYCIGACEAASGGTWQCAVQRSTPQVSHWHFQPDDVFLLCSDGLIEENLFLGREEVAVLLAQNSNQPAQTLAERLAEAADARQREPSPQEPEGFGDNITCVVLKVLNSDQPTSEN
jgi:serine/threonine protein phosphatase PrpC